MNNIMFHSFYSLVSSLSARSSLNKENQIQVMNLYEIIHNALEAFAINAPVVPVKQLHKSIKIKQEVTPKRFVTNIKHPERSISLGFLIEGHRFFSRVMNSHFTNRSFWHNT